jgi:hypothetical protein
VDLFSCERWKESGTYWTDDWLIGNQKGFECEDAKKKLIPGRPVQEQTLIFP